MSDDVFAGSLKSPVCVDNFFNGLRNVERKMKEIFILARSTQKQQIKGERQLNEVHDSAQFIVDKFKEYEEDQAEKNEIIGKPQSEFKTLLSKISKFEKKADQQGHYSRST